MKKEVYLAIKRRLEHKEGDRTVMWYFSNDGLNEGIPYTEPDYIDSFVMEYPKEKKVTAWHVAQRIYRILGSEEFDRLLLAAQEKKGVSWVEEVVSRYKCLQDETMWIEVNKDHVVIRWHNCMDRYINFRTVRNIARCIRRYTGLPIYDSVRLLEPAKQ